MPLKTLLDPQGKAVSASMGNVGLSEIKKIECLRYLEIGKKIKMVETEYMGIAIDTPEDLENAKAFIEDE